MIKSEDLVVGRYYFLLLFYPANIEIPSMKTFVYVGKNLEDSGKLGRDEWFFQDPRSFLEHGAFLQLPKKIKREVFIADEDALSQFYDLSGLIERLSRIKAGGLS